MPYETDLRIIFVSARAVVFLSLALSLLFPTLTDAQYRALEVLFRRVKE